MDGKGKQQGMVMARAVKKEIGFGGESSDDKGYGEQLMGCAEHDTEGNKKKRVLADSGGRKASGGGGGGNGVIKCCQAEGCTADLSDEKPYHRRHKVCDPHSKAQVALVDGIRQRFCQQCSRFHELSEFDETKRSCRRRLAGHNERRRKNSSEVHAEGSNRKGACTELKDVVCGKVDDKGRIKITIQEHAPCKHFHIR